MAERPLTNAGWGFESNCFVCEPRNTQGLRIPFVHDDERDVVVGRFTLGDAFSGAPTYVHGGVTMAVLDEAMAWATIAVERTFAVTASTTMSFHRPVRVGRPYTVTAQITGKTDDGFEVTAAVTNSRDMVCAEAQGQFVSLSPAQAQDAIGQDLDDDDSGYVRG